MNNLTIAIPSYNRPEELKLTLKSIAEDIIYTETDILIIDDSSPKLIKIDEVVNNFKKNFPNIHLTYLKNKTNLGYDANLRKLIRYSKGKYTMIFGDDDLIIKGSIKKILFLIDHNSPSVILRSWSSFNTFTNKIVDTNIYYPTNRFFTKGLKTSVNFFRKSVYISGLIFNTKQANSFSTNKFDGTLLYQLYLVGAMLNKYDAYYISDIISLRRVGSRHFFGTSKKEKFFFSPNSNTPTHSVNFISGMIEIAKYLDKENSGFLKLAKKDISKYSYSFLSLHRDYLSIKEYLKYCYKFFKLGLGHTIYFWIYILFLIIFGKKFCDTVIIKLKDLLKSTPNL